MGCGCVCDDLRLTIAGERIVGTERACELARPWLLAQNSEAGSAAEIAGHTASLSAALDRAAEILQSADYPLLYGLSQSTIEAQREAVALAERASAIIDTTASLCHAPSVIAQQQEGLVTCTLGEVRSRADTIVYWGSDPAVTHPRHFERYSATAVGRHTPGGRADRFLVVADTERTASAAAADLFLPIERGQHFEALFTLRALLCGVLGDCPVKNCGAPYELLAELARRMKQARSGIVFFGVGLARGEAGHCNVQALLQLVAESNEQVRWSAMRMRMQGNVVGADSVLAWQTGYPFAVSLSRGYPRYNPGEFSVHGVLERQEADACVLIGSETLSWMPPAAIEHLHRIPTIVLDPPERQTPFTPAVRFRIGAAGVQVPGTAYRMDGVPIPLRAILPTALPSDEDLLREIRQRLDDPPEVASYTLCAFG